MDTIVSNTNNLATNIVDNASNLETNLINSTNNLATGLVNTTNDLASNIVKSTDNLTAGLVTNTNNLATGLLNNTNNLANSFVNTTDSLTNSLVTNTNNLATGILNTTNNLATGLVTSTNNLASDVANNVNNLASTVTNTTSSVLNTATNYGNKALNYVKKTVTDIVNRPDLLCGIVLVLVLFIVVYHFAPKIKFINKKKLAKIVHRKTDYFKKLSDADLQFRGAETHCDYINKYINSWEPFSWSQKLRLYRVIWQINRLMPRKLKVAKWRLVKLNDDVEVESAYPHTIYNVIVLREATMKKCDKELMETLIHESIHIYQRMNKYDTGLLLQAMGFFSDQPSQTAYPLGAEDHSGNGYLNMGANERDPNYVGNLWRPHAKIRPWTNVAANPDHDGIPYYIVQNGEKQYLKTVYRPDARTGQDVMDVCVTGSAENFQPIDFGAGVSFQGNPTEIMATAIASMLVGDNVMAKWNGVINDWLNT